MHSYLYYKHNYLDPYTYKLCEFKNVVMDSTRHVIMKADNLPDPEDISYKIQSLSHDKYMLGYKGPLNPKNSIDLSVDSALYIPIYTNFYHTVIDGLPRLWSALKNDTDIVMSRGVLTFPGLYKAISEVINLSRINVYDTSLDLYDYSSVNRLRAKSLLIYSAKDKDSRITNRRLALAFWQKYADNRWTASTHSRRLFIPRTSGRDLRCINQDEVFDYLSKKHGFESWDCDINSFEDTAKAFRDSSIIVGVHGAAMSHVCFCRPGCSVFQISGRCKSESYYEYLCNVGNVKCSSIYARTFDGQIAKENSRIKYIASTTDIHEAFKRYNVIN